MSDVTELLERFRRGGEVLAVSTTGAAGAELDYTPEPGQWSVRQIICHLMDSEMVARIRFASVIAEDNPLLVATDDSAWADKLDYRKRKLSTSVEIFRKVRAENYDLLKDLPEDAWHRQGTHSQDGPLTLLSLLTKYAHHVEEHVMEIRQVRDRYKATKLVGESK